MYTSHQKNCYVFVMWDALGFFTGSGNVFAFSVGLSDCCMSFKWKSNTTIKIYIGHDVLLINEVHNVSKETVFSGI